MYLLEESINNILSALYSDPVYLLIAIILSALILYSLIKKLIKLMFYLLAVLIIYVGYLYFTGQDLPQNVDDIINPMRETIEDVSGKVNNAISNGIQNKDNK
tara:strand:+ start:523 stop:828 length:306 start_codon:yes stop_codon:yes gene_type:complete